jgi:hypothetical protein
MNLLVACLLLVLDETEAFWVFCCIMENIMPQDYYTSNLVVSQADQRVLKELATEKFPKLLKHLENNGVDISLITFNWFLTVFVDSVPPEVTIPFFPPIFQRIVCPLFFVFLFVFLKNKTFLSTLARPFSAFGTAFCMKVLKCSFASAWVSSKCMRGTSSSKKGQPLSSTTSRP